MPLELNRGLPIPIPTSADLLCINGTAVENYLKVSSRVLVEPPTILTGIGSLSETRKPQLCPFVCSAVFLR